MLHFLIALLCTVFVIAVCTAGFIHGFTKEYDRIKKEQDREYEQLKKERKARYG